MQGMLVLGIFRRDNNLQIQDHAPQQIVQAAAAYIACLAVALELELAPALVLISERVIT
jgi:hypothetical protein